MTRRSLVVQRDSHLIGVHLRQHPVAHGRPPARELLAQGGQSAPMLSAADLDTPNNGASCLSVRFVRQ
ncbi:hypothetical protein [Streptomyces sp. NBC_00046]|uniref:hypothetical protein n=1 Tax=unclassified Streptomyces TaxID=2593676 RepID=UPI0032550E30